MSDEARKTSSLVGDERYEERQCAVCKMPMKPMHRNQANSRLPWHEAGIDFNCANCQTKIYVANSNSVSLIVGTAIVIICIIGYFLTDGLLDFILNSPTGSLVSVLLSFLAMGIIYVAWRFAWRKIKRGAELIEVRIKNPMVNRKPGINMLNLSMTVGLLPWLIAIFFGYINNQFRLLEGQLIWLMLPIVILPILLGKKLGSTKMNVFLAAMFWLFIGWVIIWIVS
ncbi:MAG: hypothetical protein COB24_06840 [Hyphomicrobiales bacterium]|nr:MAG: hypothetical protein COB24_06840 [Hyphomicrobiales bacterium]